MESPELKHRTRDEPRIDDDTPAKETSMPLPPPIKQRRRTAAAKRGLRSLGFAVAVPLCLTIADVSVFGSSHRYSDLPKPFWFPPLWALHMVCLASSLLMGLSAWLVWAEGGFHRNPTGLALYMAQLALCLAWDPIVLAIGSIRVGLLVCLAIFGAQLGCSRVFGDVNPIAGDLVKPCLAWALFMAMLNLKLLYL